MSAFVGLVGMLGFVVCLVLLIVAAIRKKSKKGSTIGLAVCLVLFIVGIATSSPAPVSTAGENKKAVPVVTESSTKEPDVSEAEPVFEPVSTSPEAPPATEPPASSEPKPSEPSAPVESTVPAEPEKEDIKIEFTGKIEPTLLSVGDKLVFTLIVKNLSEEAIDRFFVSGDGKWGDFTIANVMPSASYGKGLLGWTFISSLEVPAGEQRAINIVLYPNKAGNYEFSFIPHPSEDGRDFEDENGDSIVIGGSVAVVEK